VRGSVKSIAKSPIPINARVLGIGFEGFADASLNYRLAGGVAALTGDLILQQSKVDISTDVIYRRPSIGVSETSLLFNLGIGLGKGVRVSFAPRGIPIIMGNGDPSSRLSIIYDQAKGDYLLKGEALIRGGEAFYINRSFFIKSARILFNENPDKFNPLVTINAEARDSNEAGPVTVYLRAENAPLRDFRPRLSSSPPMSEIQIAAMLGQSLVGMDPSLSDYKDLNLARGLIGVSEIFDLFPQANIIKGFETRVRELLGIDVFYLRSKVVRQLLYDVSGQSAKGRNTEQLIADYLDGTSLYAGMYLGPVIFAFGEARLREDPLVSPLPLALDSEIGVEFDTPFGLLQWSVAPKVRELEFFPTIRDQSLSLSWRLFL
jgi:hypothetical protein